MFVACMTREEFITRSIKASIFLAGGSVLVSCLNEDRDFINTGFDNSHIKNLIQPIYLVSENLDVSAVKAESAFLLSKWTVVKELITYGYITSSQMIPENIVFNSKFKIVRLNEHQSCIIFNRPIRTYLPNTFRGIEYRYTIYEELREKFLEKKVVF